MIGSIRGRRPNIIVLDDIGLEVKPLEDFVFYGGGKGGGGGVQYIPMQQEPTNYTPPPAPNPVEEEATMELATESDEDMALRKSATRTGAKSLRIPIGTNNTLGQM